MTSRPRRRGELSSAANGDLPRRPRLTGLSKESVANVSQIVTLDKSLLVERVGRLPPAKVRLIFSGIDVVLGR